jgi:hypothetical protein
MHKGDLERGMLNLWPTLDIQRSNRYQVRAQVDKVKSQFLQSARDNITQLYDRHWFESVAVHCEFIDSLLAHNMSHSPIGGHVERDVRSPIPTQKESKAANQWLAST